METGTHSTSPGKQRITISLPVLGILLAVFLLIPVLFGSFWVEVATEILVLGLFALSFNLIYGYMGQISFGHAAFFGLGAYATALIMQALTGGSEEITLIGFLLALLASIPVAALGALIVGYFCVRLTGIYFAILTLAFGELLFFIVFSWYSFTGGDNGIQRLLPPEFLRNPSVYFYFCLGVVSLAVACMWRICQSPFGFILRAMRDNQERTRFLGINTRLYMHANFVIAGAFAGLAGGLWGPFTRSVAPSLLGWQESGIAVFMTLLGGAGLFAGPLVGSILYTFLHAWVTGFTQYWPLTIGLIIMMIVLYSPGGLLGVLDAWLARRHARTRKTETPRPVDDRGGQERP